MKRNNRMLVSNNGNVKKICFLLLFVFVSLSNLDAQHRQDNTIIKPGEVWPDQNGDHIQAHGGGIIKVLDTYYWYGEERRVGLDSNYRYVSCYASKDLANWEFKGDALKMTDPDSLGSRWILERPKVYHNVKYDNYVMYMHVDGPVKGQAGNYRYAHVGVATSKSPLGPFTFLKTFRPLGHESRDIGQFIDDDGSAYLIFEDRPVKGFHIVKLSDDYLSVEKEMCLIKLPLEGGAVVHYKGLYYAIGSALTSWFPNPNKYATATSLEGPWSEFKDIAPPETKTYGSQSTLMLKVEGSKTTSVIFMADMWRPKKLWDSRYLWMPLEIKEDKLWLPAPKPWSINTKTGEVTLLNSEGNAKNTAN